MSLFEELKRRNVVRMAVLYVVASWLILQVADVLFDHLAVPAWAFSLVLAFLALGFPFALIFSWVFEITPEGLKRERDVDRQHSITPQTGHKMNIAIILLLVLAIGGLIANRLVPRPPSALQSAATASSTGSRGAPGEVRARQDHSVAVLPFVNMSDDPENEYFSDGLSEELLNRLAQISELNVTGRTSSFAFKGKNLDLREIGQKLNVANVLEGSVRKAANRVRITAQLIKTSDGYHLWSQSYDRELNDIFAIQQEIAEQVAAALSVTLLGEPAETAGETHNTEAYQAYLRGMHVFRRAPDDPDTLQQVRTYFEQALALDPNYISPLYGMFQYWERMNRNGNGAFDVTAGEMKKIADQLEQLAPGSMEALLARATSYSRSRIDSKALALYREARDRYPGNVETNIGYAGLLFPMGHPDEALAASKAAIKLDPLSLKALGQLSFIEMQLGHCSKVKQLADRALKIEPDYGRVRGQVAYCLLISSEDPTEALSWAKKEPVAWMRRTAEAIALHRLGRQQEAEQLLKQLIADAGDTASFQYAQIYAQWGQTEKALDWLQKALDVHDPGIIGLGNDPLLDPLRREPRFQALLRQAGWGETGTGQEGHSGPQ